MSLGLFEVEKVGKKWAKINRFWMDTVQKGEIR